MIGTRRYDSLGDGGEEINIATLIDMVFILLIFFLVTTSFVRETGVEIAKPTAATASELEPESILVALTREGTVHMDERPVSLLSLRGRIRERLRAGELPVVIVADEEARTGALVEVLDECKRAGATSIHLASETE
jgi:biopolymer transport protein ExbD